MFKKIIFLLLFNLFLFLSFSESFSNYSNYTKSNYTSIKWNSDISSAYNNIKNFKYYSAIADFLSAINKGCKSQQIFEDCLKCYVINNQLKEGVDLINNYWSEDKKTIGYNLIAQKYLEKKDYINAIDYFKKSNLSKSEFEKIGDDLFNSKNYESSIQFYYNSDISQEKNQKLADYYFNQKLYEYAFIYYEKNKITDKMNECSNNIIKISYENHEYLKTADYYTKLGLDKRTAGLKVANMLVDDANKLADTVPDNIDEKSNKTELQKFIDALSYYMSAQNFYTVFKDEEKFKYCDEKIKKLKQKYKGQILEVDRYHK
jgi:tetratricopeptide (TPR) repeat protein